MQEGPAAGEPPGSDDVADPVIGRRNTRSQLEAPVICLGTICGMARGDLELA